MPERVRVKVNGRELEMPAEASVAAALMSAGVSGLRRSRTGEPRGPVCGMGVCMECRVRVDGRAHQRACQFSCREGMEIECR